MVLWFYGSMAIVYGSYGYLKVAVSDRVTIEKLVVVVLPDPFRGMGAWRNSTETQQTGHAVRFRLEVKNGRSGAEDGAPERRGCGTIHEEVS